MSNEKDQDGNPLNPEIDRALKAISRLFEKPSNFKDDLDLLEPNAMNANIKFYNNLYKSLEHLLHKNERMGSVSESALKDALQTLSKHIASQFYALMLDGKTSVQLSAWLNEFPVKQRMQVARELLSNFEISFERNIFYNHLAGLVGVLEAESMQAAYTEKNLPLYIDSFIGELSILSDSNLSHNDSDNHMTLAKDIIAKMKKHNALNYPDSGGYTLLDYAVVAYNVELVNILLENGADPNIKNLKSGKQQSTFQISLISLQQLNSAAENIYIQPSLEIIDSMLKYQANPIDSYVLKFVESINMAYLTEMFEKQPDVIDLKRLCNIINNSQDMEQDLKSFDYERVVNGRLSDGSTPLIIAANIGNRDAIRILSESVNINPNLTDEHGNTFLHYAADLGKPGFVSLILKMFGRSISETPIRVHPINVYGHSPMNISMLNRNFEDQNVFLNTDSALIAKQIIDALSDSSQMMQDLAVDLMQDVFGEKNIEVKLADIINYADPELQANILSASINVGNMRAFKIIIDNIELFDDKQSVLNYALINAIVVCNDFMVNQLIANGADVNFVHDGSSMLLNAARYGNGVIAQALLDNGAEIDFQDEVKSTPLSIAAHYKNKSFIEVMLKNGANKNLINKYGDTALSISLKIGSHDVAREIEKDLMLAGYTELMVAILDGEHSRIDQILANDKYIKKNINQVNAGGFSALMVVASKYSMTEDLDEHEYLAKLAIKLIELGADIEVVNKTGLNFLNLAESGRMYNQPGFIGKICELYSVGDIVKNNHGRNIMHLCMQFNVNMLTEVVSNLGKRNIENYINTLDDSGSSPLSYILFDTVGNLTFNKIRQLVDVFGAKFIRNGNEIRTGLQLKILLSKLDTDLNDIFLAKDKLTINNQDEQGLTALHYACIQGNFDLANLLIQHGAKANIQDNSGRTAVHYAAIKDHVLPGTVAADIVIEDLNGVTPLVMAYQYGASNAWYLLDNIFNANVYKRKNQENIKYEHSPITKVFLDYMTADVAGIFKRIEDIKIDDNLNFKQKLIVLSALSKQLFTTKYNHEYGIDLIERVGKEILNSEFSDPNNYANYEFERGWGIGIELEVPELPTYTMLRVSELESLFSVTTVSDATVHPSVISLYNKLSEKNDLEFVSDIIQDSQNYNRFLTLFDILTQGGAKVNRTSGMHIHVNCRGGTNDTNDPADEIQVAPLFDQSDPHWKEKELVYVTFVLLNFISIEQLLRGFMREGVLFDEYGSSYVEAISKHREGILACDKLKELQEKYCAHTKTLDLTALDKHGTIEFRAHDGVVEPILVNAWAECVTRLCAISYKQALEYIDPKSTKPKVFEPKQDIEQLVYLLIAQRNYNKTWDAKWGATKSANIRSATEYPGYNKAPIQVQIQQSPFYQLLNICIQYFDGKDGVDSMQNLSDKLSQCIEMHKFGEIDNKDEAKTVFKDLSKMLEFIRDNPGVIKHKIDLAKNRTEQYNELMQEVSTLAVPFDNKGSMVKL